MQDKEKRALLGIAALAARVDGSQAEAEQEQLAAIARGLFGRDIAEVRPALVETLVADLETPGTRERAYELALSMCNVDGELAYVERQFLDDLARQLELDRSVLAEFETRSTALVAEPLAGAAAPAEAAELDALIHRCAIQCAALELLPQGLATLAILPLQMRLVYRIGKRHGFELGRAHIKDFLAAAGVGMVSQSLENAARRLFGGMLGALGGGGFLRGLGRQAAGSAFTFSTTYALGRVADRYYASGRKLSAAELRETFSRLFEDAQRMAGGQADAIERRAGELRGQNVLSVVRDA